MEVESKSDENMEESCSTYEPNSDGVPVDLFVSKKTNGSIIFRDSSSNILFSVDRPHHQNHPFKRVLSDSSGTPLLFISHNKKAKWEGFTTSDDGHDPVFRVERTTKTLTRLEFQVFLTTANQNSVFTMRGSPFYRSCTIYKADSIVAQTSLMYKLGIQQLLVPRNRFRLTIFPGYTAHHPFIVAFTLIFFYSRKFWI